MKRMLLCLIVLAIALIPASSLVAQDCPPPVPVAGSVFCCCQTFGGGTCCAYVSFCGSFIPGCLCSLMN